MALLCLILFNLNAFNNRFIVHGYLHGFFSLDSTPCIADSKPSIVTTQPKDTSSARHSSRMGSKGRAFWVRMVKWRFLEGLINIPSKPNLRVVFFWRWTFFKKKTPTKTIQKINTHREKERVKSLDFCWFQGWHPTIQTCLSGDAWRHQVSSCLQRGLIWWRCLWEASDMRSEWKKMSGVKTFSVRCRIFAIFGKPWKKNWVIYFWITRKQM